MQQKSPRRGEIGQMASDIKIQLSNILNSDGENQGDSDSDEAASVASFSGVGRREEGLYSFYIHVVSILVFYY